MVGRPAVKDDDHWISRWQRSIASAQWLERAANPDAQSGAQSGVPSGADALVAQSEALSHPIVVVTHGHGVEVLLSARDQPKSPAIRGAFIVAPTLNESRLADISGEPSALPCPSVVIAPDDHPVLTASAAQNFAAYLGGHYVSAGTVGRLDAGSGHGPWPEGLMRLGWFLKRLSAH